MKAINLIPADQRRGAGGAAGRTGGAAYALVGLLAAALLIFGSWTVTNRQIKERTAEAASLEEQAQMRSQQASALGPYTKFAELRSSRVDTVKRLVDTRFDWAHAFGEISRVLPESTWLTAMTGTIAPGVGSDVGGTSDPLRTARPVPAIEMAGCSTSQTAVTQFIARLRLINGVDRVAISSSKRATTDKPDENSGPTDSAASVAGQKYTRKDPCTTDRPSFSLVIFFKGLINPPGKSGKPELNTETGAGTATTAGAAPPAGGTATAPAPGGSATTPAAGGTATTPTTPAPAAGGTQ